MSTTSRAQPDVLDLSMPEQRAQIGKITRHTKVGYAMRLPFWVKQAAVDAAEREDLSLNQWLVRVVAEISKASREGWRSIAPDDTRSRAGLYDVARSNLTRPPNPLHPGYDETGTGGSGTSTPMVMPSPITGRFVDPLTARLGKPMLLGSGSTVTLTSASGNTTKLDASAVTLNVGDSSLLDTTFTTSGTASTSRFVIPDSDIPELM